MASLWPRYSSNVRTKKCWCRFPLWQSVRYHRSFWVFLRDTSIRSQEQKFDIWTNGGKVKCYQLKNTEYKMKYRCLINPVLQFFISIFIAGASCSTLSLWKLRTLTTVWIMTRLSSWWKNMMPLLTSLSCCKEELKPYKLKYHASTWDRYSLNQSSEYSNILWY